MISAIPVQIRKHDLCTGIGEVIGLKIGKG